LQGALNKTSVAKGTKRLQSGEEAETPPVFDANVLEDLDPEKKTPKTLFKYQAPGGDITFKKYINWNSKECVEDQGFCKELLTARSNAFKKKVSTNHVDMKLIFSKHKFYIVF
jgi:hypothetical protein